DSRDARDHRRLDRLRPVFEWPGAGDCGRSLEEGAADAGGAARIRPSRTARGVRQSAAAVWPAALPAARWAAGIPAALILAPIAKRSPPLRRPAHSRTGARGGEAWGTKQRRRCDPGTTTE